MNKIERGKTSLIVLGIVCLVLSVALVVFGVLSVVGAVSGESINVFKLVLGIVLLLLFVPALILGIYLTWVGASLNATNGSIAEGNLGVGTVNKTLCPNCGTQLNGEKFCPNCGAEVSGLSVCSKCGATNSVDNAFCKECGASLKD